MEDDNRKSVDTSVAAVPVPSYVLVRHSSGLWHLIDSSEPSLSEEPTTRCGTAIRDDFDTKSLVEFLDWEDIMNDYEGVMDLAFFEGQCQQCLQSHRSSGADDSARFENPNQA